MSVARLKDALAEQLDIHESSETAFSWLSRLTVELQRRFSSIHGGFFDSERGMTVKQLRTL